MSTINFYLKPANKDGNSSILLVYQHQGKKFKYATGISVLKTEWKDQRIKGKSLAVIEQNKKLTSLKFLIQEIEAEEQKNNQSLNPAKVRMKFLLKVRMKPGESEFFTLFDQFMTNSRTTKTVATVRNYGSTKTRLKEFQDKHIYEMTFKSINHSFYEKFIKFLITDLGLLNNTVGSHIKTLKAFLNYLKDNELTNEPINMKGFKAFKEDIDIIALTDEELFRLYNLQDLPENLELVRDYFCFECFTGMRFSDITKIQNENYKGDYLEFRTQKTKDSLIVPLNVFAKEIIEKYTGRYEGRPLPPTFSNQRTNTFIRDVAEIAGIVEITIIEKFSGSNRLIIKKPKCDLISTHTGRRTFITLSYEKGMQIEMIMKITGIKRWDTLKKYLKVSEKAKLLQMNTYWNRNVSIVV